MTNEQYIKGIENLFSKNGNPERAKGAENYLLNQFKFFGLDTTKRRLLSKEFIIQNGIPEQNDLKKLVHLLWKKEQRELQYFGMELLEKKNKETGKTGINLYEYLIVHKSWWDTVDFIAPKLVAGLFLRYPEMIKKVIPGWVSSGNIWLNRSALLFQLKYKEKTDSKLLFKTIQSFNKEKEFFIRKAIGWSLREYSKTNPDEVMNFVNSTPLSGLSKREALKHIQNG